MKPFGKLAAVALLLGCSAALAVAPPVKAPANMKPTRADDQLDFLYLASDRPVLLRLHVRLGQKPYSDAWNAYMDKLFTWLDNDKNGFISKAEAKRMPPGYALNNMLSGSIGYYAQGQTIPFATIDKNKDGKLSRAEFKAYYRTTGCPALRFQLNTSGAQTAKTINKTIWKLLDRNKDGRLSREELDRAPGMMKKQDENEDELLSTAELGSSTNQYGYATAVSGYSRPGMVQLQQMMEITADTNLEQLAKQLVQRYDTNKDGKLAAKEIAFSADLFKSLDKNSDGFLTANELLAWLQGEPDLVFRARVGPAPGSMLSGLMKKVGLNSSKMTPRLESLIDKTAAMSKVVKRLDADTMKFPLGDADLELQATEGSPSYFNGVRNYYSRQFMALDTDKKDVIEKKAAAGNYYINQIFDLADRDSDGKLTRKEFDAFMDMQAVGSGCWLTLQFNDQGQSLFDLIDTDRNGSLSLRELRNAWTSVKALSKDGKALSEKDIRRRITVTLGKGYSYYRASPVGGMVNRGKPANAGAPSWFIKMDRNGDGDISPKEWIGAQEDFDKIDTDGDGLLSVAEAKAYEARLKKEAKKPAKTEKK